MFKKYEKTFRVQVPQFDVPGKHHLGKKEAKEFLRGRVDIEEKLDGANTGIIRHRSGFHLQKRGSLVGQSEHAQFQYFHHWANVFKYDQIMALPKSVIVYGELMRCVHSIYYDRLPDWFIVFDVLVKNKWLNRRQKEEFCAQYGFTVVPLIHSGFVTLSELHDFMPTVSAFGDIAEGMTVKRYAKKKYSRAKLVWPDFIKRMEEGNHWTKTEMKFNKVI